MEIRKIEINKKIEYPKLYEVNNEKLKHSIPKKWSRVGIIACLFNIMVKSKALATPILAPLAGDLPRYNPIYNNIRKGCNIVSVISAICVLTSSIILLCKKNKDKKENIEKKQRKKFNILFIISITIFILSIAGQFVANYLEEINFF